MREHVRATRRRSRARTSGQALLIFVVAFTVLVGFTGLSIDVGHAYVVHRQTQDATDAAALAGGKQLLATPVVYNTPPDPQATPAPLQAAHDYAQQNGFTTAYRTGAGSCESYASTGASPHLDETWFNSGFGGACTATTGFSTKVEFHTPAVFSAGEPSPPDCAPSSTLKYNCVQVIITSLISNYFLSALGFPSQYTVTRATAFAAPPTSLLGTPPATAVYLYEPQAGCVAPKTCFNDGASAPAPSRTQLSCTGGNCPTFWAQQGTSPSIYGYDGSTQAPPIGDTPALSSNGDMVIADNTTICDPYGQGATWCSGNAPAVAGAMGYSQPAGSKVFCAQGGSTYPQTAPTTPNACSSAPAGWPKSKTLDANGVPFTPCNTTCSIKVTNTLDHQCGALVLNGESVQSHYNSSDPCYPGTGDEYTLQPGTYSYIVINHGQYNLDSGTYEITGKPPAGVIDHSGETSADFDLCTNYSNANKCPNLSAGVWIGHGTGSFTAASAGGSGGTCSGSGGAGTGAGGGDQTSLTGAGVTFLLDPGSGGFVSTNEVQSISLSSPGGSHSDLSGLPVLIDNEDSSFIHLDGQPGGGKNASTSGFSGIVYQTPNATSGGVELDPSLGGNTSAAVVGQVLAYSLTTFGGSGTAVDFSGGYGAAGGLSISSSGHSESSIIVSNTQTYSPRKIDNADGTETVVLDYTDEWALDGYDTYMKINSGSPIFFSQNVWTCTPTNSCGGALPPQGNFPSDNTGPPIHAAVHPATATSGYTNGPGKPGPSGANLLQGTKTVPSSNDWIETLTISGQQYKFETLGDWTWGHEKDISGNSAANPNLAEISLTFPKPTSGTSFTVSIFMEDGDHCGDYASAQYTFPLAAGQPGGGSASGGGVQLEE